MRIVTPTLYRDYKEFMSAMTKHGGVIEAIPYTIARN